MPTALLLIPFPPLISGHTLCTTPSQTAEDDPGTWVCIPIFWFGLGGHVASCFHTQLDAITGVDVSLTGRMSSPILMWPLKSLIPSSAIGPSTSEFPHPLFPCPTLLAIIKAVLKYLWASWGSWMRFGLYLIIKIRWASFCPGSCHPSSCTMCYGWEWQ